MISRYSFARWRWRSARICDSLRGLGARVLGAVVVIVIPHFCRSGRLIVRWRSCDVSLSKYTRMLALLRAVICHPGGCALVLLECANVACHVIGAEVELLAQVGEL